MQQNRLMCCPSIRTQLCGLVAVLHPQATPNEAIGDRMGHNVLDPDNGDPFGPLF
jgi:hypothetical protein